MTSLTLTDYQAAAIQLNLPVAVIQAVAEVESQSKGFLVDGRPVILFERHIFYKRLKQYGFNVAELAHDYPHLVNLSPGGYQAGNVEYERLAMAQQIHETSAYEATGWGAFQIMGWHWQALGYASLNDFIVQMQRSAHDQLDAFVRYLNYQPALINALQTQQWADFAKGYNGIGYARYGYDHKLAQAWAKYARVKEAHAEATYCL